ncbi:MAG: hypothetical protein ACJA2W_000160 [Planctomycetota bacterium]|jgi:hypothetical protein
MFGDPVDVLVGHLRLMQQCHHGNAALLPGAGVVEGGRSKSVHRAGPVAGADRGDLVVARSCLA